MVQLQPHRAPAWLRPLVDALQAGEGARVIRETLGARVHQKGGDDQAAVLIVFAGDPHATELPHDARVLITHRTPSMRSHSGQMAFPGGHIDPEDSGPVAAAIREAEEETGLEPARVVPLAVMGAATTGGSNRRVRPVVAYTPNPNEVYPASEFETDDVFFVPVRDLVDPANRAMLGWSYWSGPAFWARRYLIWGFTGVLLSAVLEVAGWAVEWDKEPADLTEALARSDNREL